MSVGSVVGFGALAVVLLTTFSLIAAAIAAMSRDRAMQAGPAFERSVAAWALLAPLALALSVVVLLAILGSRGVDHCVGHDHHAHFCLVHGAAWLERPWAIVVAAAASVTIVLRVGVIALRRIRARHAIRQIRRVSDAGEGVRIAHSDRSFCFIAGLWRPEVFISTRAWNALSAEERDAVIVHEHSHAAHGDLWLGMVLDVAAVFAAPLCGSWLHASWADASERLCDLQAAAATSRETVASALVQMYRAGQPQYVPVGFTAASGTLEQRVRAVLSNRPMGERLGVFAWAALLLAVAAIALLATPLHHALETLLG